MRILPALCLYLSLPLFAGSVYTDPKTGLMILSDEIELPADGFWVLSESSLYTNNIGYAYIEAPEAHYDQSFGKRNQALRERRLLNERRRLMWNTRYLLGSYQEEKVTLSPEDFTSLNLTGNKQAGEALRSGKIAIVPGVPVFEKVDENAKILLVELQPQVDDGKHFIYYNNWKLVRGEIDTEKMQALGLEVRPPAEIAPEAKTVRYTVKARLLDPSTKEIQLHLKNDYPAGEMTVTIPVDGRTDSREAFNEWAKYRVYSWGMDDSRLVEMWDRQVQGLYDLKDFIPPSNPPGNNRNRGSSLMGVLGGDAAIRETLQMQNLLLAGDEDVDQKLIPITEVKGVTVKAHDYEELLDGQAGGSLEMATRCPPDRLFAWFPNPEGILQLLDGSGNVLGRFSTTRSKLILDHRILEKHLAKLGLTEAQLKLILNSGFVGESVVILPDLFLSEGTDVTSIIRITNRSAITPLLKKMGLGVDAAIHEIVTPAGTAAFVSLAENFLMISSSRTELQKIKEVASGAQPNLAQTAEFRYMLTQCGPTDQTAAYVYLSDPFIRRLTGPALKIAQMRRLQAKGELETLSAGNLLYRMDHRRDAPDIKTLVDAGYAPAPSMLGKPEWKDGAATDPLWGSAAQSPTLTDRLPTEVTSMEKKAYDQYRNQYERFWRQFFDPIAVRVDLKPEQEVETTVFILPLINSSIYDQVRQFFPANDQAQPGKRPHIDPAPIAMMSLNLSEERWIDFLEGISEVIADQLGLELPVWEQLGPGIHVGLADSDSIITFGSGELVQLFSAGNNLRGNEMLFLPMIGSLFTRPVVIAMDLQNPEAAREALRGMVTGTLVEQNGFLDMNVNLVKITGQDRWLIRLRVGDVLFITLSMEVQDDFLVFSNLPLTYHPKVTGSTALPLRDANVLLLPEAIEETGPGFAASALDIAREQAMAGLGVLNLYHMAGAASLEEALHTSNRHFGYTPVHPSPGEFVWTDAGPESTVFGALYTGEQPPLEDVDLTGLLPQTEKVEISMQLENGGLRTRLLWKGKTLAE